MKEYKTKNIRNVGLIGHSGSGKTTLTEALLYFTKCTDRLGKISEGNTVSDYDNEEKKRKISVATTIEPIEYNNTKINIIDIPGYFDFEGEYIEGLNAADAALIVLSGVSGIKAGTEKAWKYADKLKMPRGFYINKLDRENSSFEKVLSSLKITFEKSILPIQYPIGSEKDFDGIINIITGKASRFNSKICNIEECSIPEYLLEKIAEYKNTIIEAVAETDEILLEKYLNTGTLSDDEIYKGLINGIISCDIVPVMCGCSYSSCALTALLSNIVKCFPSPDMITNLKVKNIKGDYLNFKIDENKPFAAKVFKTIADPYVGKLSLFRIMSGNIKSDSLVYNINKNKTEKIGTIYILRGKTEIPTSCLYAGDIGAVSKLLFTSTGDTLCSENNRIIFDEFDFPSPSISMAVIPKGKGDEEKISVGLAKLLEEDPTFKVIRDNEYAETIISGLGETHLEIIAGKLKNKFGANVTLELPKVPYRETIKKSADVQGKHKKQSGGHGQYGDVWIKFEPRIDGKDELEFIDNVVGGVVPRQYIPAVEKGLHECVLHGILARFPVIKLKAILHDGSFHPVDSSEMAFKIAASIAYKKGLEAAHSVILEPIMHIEVTVPKEYMGDVITDLNKKRGKVLGMEASDDNLKKVIAEVPQAEIFKYSTDLRSITHARGSFRMNLERYDEVPENESNKIIENALKFGNKK